MKQNLFIFIVITMIISNSICAYDNYYYSNNEGDYALKVLGFGYDDSYNYQNYNSKDYQQWEDPSNLYYKPTFSQKIYLKMDGFKTIDTLFWEVYNNKMSDVQVYGNPAYPDSIDYINEYEQIRVYPKEPYNFKYWKNTYYDFEIIESENYLGPKTN